MSPRPLSIDLVPAPVDQNEEATRAVECVTAIAAEYDVAVRAVHVLGEDVVRAIEQGVVGEDVVAGGSKAVTDTVLVLVETVDVSVTTSVAHGFLRTNKPHHPGSVVPDTAEELNADFIAMPREPVSGDPGKVFAKAAEYVLLYISQPVLSV